VSSWDDITPTALATAGLWDSTSGSRRRMNLFKGVSSSSGTGALTATYASQPADVDIVVVELTGADDTVTAGEAAANSTPGVLVEAVTMPSPGSSANRLIAFVDANVNLTGANPRFELTTDTGGDANWTTGTPRYTGSSPTATYIWGYLGASPATDLTVGWHQDGPASPLAYMMVVEVQATVAAGNSQGSWGYQAVFGTPATTGLSSILEPVSGALLGATVAAAGVQTSSSTAGLTYYNSMVGVRPAQIIGIYKTGNWDGSFSAAELSILADAGGGDPAIPHVRWKPGNTSSAGSFTDLADGTITNSVLDTAFSVLSTWPGKMFISIWHEPEDNVPASGSNQDWIDGWIRCHDRAAGQGATNLVWVPNFVGWRAHAVDHIVPMLAGIVGYFDWISWDPYINSDNYIDLNDLVNDNDGGEWTTVGGYDGLYDWATTVYPGVPLMLSEWGIDGGPASTTGGSNEVSEAEAEAYMQNVIDTVQDFTEIKAWEYWHSKATLDAQWPDRTSSTGESLYIEFSNLAYFDQDTNLAYD
jgi:hypothetical protein